MKIFSEAKKVDLFWKLMNNDYSNISVYPFVPQKKSGISFSSDPLPEAGPEEMEVSSELFSDFYKEFSETAGLDPHSAVIVKNGKVISKAAWKPYRTDIRHVTYSVSKSIVSMAIGIAESEGLLSLDEKLVDIFPEKTTLLTSRNMKSVTIEHLLTMTSGAHFCEINYLLEEDWVKGFIASDTKFQPGTSFEYNSMNTYILSAILQKRYNCDLVEFLQSRVFTPLGIKDVAWETCPQGIAKGGWGCYLSTEELAKFGLLYLNKGKWLVDGKEEQLIPASWVERSTAAQIKNSDRKFEYGYQIWNVSELEGYMFNGMFGQYVIVLPKQQLVIALNGGCDSFFARDEVIQLIKKCFVEKQYPILRGNRAREELKRIEKSLEYRKPLEIKISLVTWYEKIVKLLTANSKKEKQMYPAEVYPLLGKQFKFDKKGSGLLPIVVQAIQGNFARGMESIGFILRENAFCIQLQEGEEQFTIPIGFSEYLNAGIQINGESYEIASKGYFATDEDDNLVLKITICFTELASTRFLKVYFMKDDKIIVKPAEYPLLETLLTDSIKKNPQYIPKVVKDTMKNQREFVDFLFQQIVAPTLYGRLVPSHFGELTATDQVEERVEINNQLAEILIGAGKEA